MFADLLDEWLNEPPNNKSEIFSASQINAMKKFAEWLDTQRSPTTRGADASKQDMACEHEWLASTLPGILAICIKCGAETAIS